MRITNPILRHAIDCAKPKICRHNTRVLNKEIETANRECVKAMSAWCRDPGNTKLRREATQKRKILEALWNERDGTSASN